MYSKLALNYMERFPLNCMDKYQRVNKNALQWDAYRPLVDRIPACTAWGCLPGGVCLGGVCPDGGYLSQHEMGQTPLWTDRHLWKHNLRKRRLRAVIITLVVHHLTCTNFCPSHFAKLTLVIWSQNPVLHIRCIQFPKSIYTSRQRSCGKVMFSVMRVCRSVCPRGSPCNHYPWTSLTRPHGQVPLQRWDMGTNLTLAPFPHTWDMTPHQYWQLVAIEACTVDKRSVRILLEGFLV